MIDLFGRLPVHSRQNVRHVIAMPSSSAHAYSYGDNIAMFGAAATILSVWIHETAHSIDGHSFESYIGAGNHFSGISTADVLLDQQLILNRFFNLDR